MARTTSTTARTPRAANSKAVPAQAKPVTEEVPTDAANVEAEAKQLPDTALAQIEVDLKDLGTPYGAWRRDYTTDAGYVRTYGFTYREILTAVGAISPTGVVNPKEINVPAHQRKKLPVGTTVYKRQMMKDIMRGTALPSGLMHMDEKTGRGEVDDGQQRVHTLATAVAGAIAHESAAPHDLYEELYEELKEEGYRILNASDLLDHVWDWEVRKDHTMMERKRLFIIRNVDKSNVSVRHQTEMWLPEWIAKFNELGIGVATEAADDDKTAKGAVKAKVKKAQAGKALESLYAYATGNPNVTAKDLLRPGAKDTLVNNLKKVTEEVWGSDFKEFYNVQIPAMGVLYGKEWGQAKSLGDTLLCPIMAGLGKARTAKNSSKDGVSKRHKFLSTLLSDANEGQDPLFIGAKAEDGTYEEDTLLWHYSRQTGAVGGYQRKILGAAYSAYYQGGKNTDEMPVNWSIGA